MEKKIKPFTDLDAWKEGHKLVLAIYKLTDRFPRKEIYTLAVQMRKAAVSITSNIAEGFSRRSYKEKIQFYSMAQGSLTELQNQLMVARDVGYIPQGQFAEIFRQTVRVQKVINGLIRKSRTIRNS